MSSISSVGVGQANYLQRYYQSSLDDENKGKNVSNDGLAQLMSCIQNKNGSSSLDVQSTQSGCSIGGAFDPAMMRELVNNQETNTQNAESKVSAMDTDGDGIVTKEEFLAAKPDDVTDEMAGNLWSQFDTEGAGSLSTDDLSTAMAEGMQGPPPPPPSKTASQDDEAFSDRVSAMDTDGDGIVTKEEFLAAKPDDVTDEMAENLWSQFDTEGVGSLSTDELTTAMAEGMQGPPPPPFMTAQSQEDETVSGGVSAMDTNGDGIVSREEFLAAKPDDVTDEMAENLWSQFDTEGAGSLSADELTTAMAEDQSTGSSLSFSSQFANLQQLLEAVRSYDMSSSYGNISSVRNSLQALV